MAGRDHLPDNFRFMSRFRFLVKVQGPSGQSTSRGGCRYRNRNMFRNRSRNRNRCRNVFYFSGYLWSDAEVMVCMVDQ